MHFLLTKLRELGFQSISADIGIDALSFIILQFAHTLQREKLHSDACQLYEDLFEETALKSKEPDKSTLLFQAIEHYGRLLWGMAELEKAEEQLVYIRKVKLQNFGDDDPRFLEADKDLSGLQGRLNNIRANLSRAIVSSQGPTRPSRMGNPVPQMGDSVLDEDVMDDKWQLIQIAKETREHLEENSLEYYDAVVNLAHCTPFSAKKILPKQKQRDKSTTMIAIKKQTAAIDSRRRIDPRPSVSAPATWQEEGAYSNPRSGVGSLKGLAENATEPTRRPMSERRRRLRGLRTLHHRSDDQIKSDWEE